MSSCPECHVTLISSGQAGSMLKVTPARVRALLAEGRILGTLVGATWVIDRASVAGLAPRMPTGIHFENPPPTQAPLPSQCPHCGEPFLNTRRAAAILGTSRQNIYAALARDLSQLGAFRIGQRVVLTQSGLRRYQTRQRLRQLAGESEETELRRIAEILRTGGFDDSFPEDQEWLSTAQAAALTGYTANYIAHLAHEGHVPAKKQVRDWWVKRDALLAYKARMATRRRKKKRKTDATTNRRQLRSSANTPEK
jgi:hypothetical protein